MDPSPCFVYVPIVLHSVQLLLLIKNLKQSLETKPPLCLELVTIVINVVIGGFSGEDLR